MLETPTNLEIPIYEKVTYVAKLAYETVNYKTGEPEIQRLGDFLINNYGIMEKSQNKIILELIEHPELLERTLAKKASGKYNLKICKSVEECKQLYKEGKHGSWCDYYYVWGIAKNREVTYQSVLARTNKVLTKDNI